MRCHGSSNCSKKTGVGAGGAGVFVAGTGVAVAGIGVAVGGIGVSVGGTGVAVGGMGVLVGGTGVSVGGMGVSVGGAGVSVGDGVAPTAGVGVEVGGRGVAVGTLGVSVGDAGVSVGEMTVAVAVTVSAGGLVGVGVLVGLRGGRGVGVGKAGAHKRCPARMRSLVRQLTSFRRETVVRCVWAMRESVCPRCTVNRRQPRGGLGVQVCRDDFGRDVLVLCGLRVEVGEGVRVGVADICAAAPEARDEVRVVVAVSVTVAVPTAGEGVRVGEMRRGGVARGGCGMAVGVAVGVDIECLLSLY
jgi:hypothetical protein